MRFTKAVCQSCGTPILRDLDKGTEKAGVISETYCRRCYLWGAFTEPRMTAREMRESVRLRMIEKKMPRFLAVLLAYRVYGLKRWEGSHA